METEIIDIPNPTTKRLMTLAVNDEDIDIMIRVLVQNGGFGSSNPDIENIIRQLKAEQKRLFYPEQIKTP